MWFINFLCLFVVVFANEYDDADYKVQYQDKDDYATSDYPVLSPPRVKRFSVAPTLKTLNDDEIREVKDALKQILGNIDTETPGTEEYQTEEPENVTRIRRDQDVVRRFLYNKKEGTTLPELDVSNLTVPLPTALPTAKYPIDVPALLELIANLAEDYESNLTKKLNESLQLLSIPTCETFTPFHHTTSEYDANATGTVIAKCFVCGLEEEGVPRSAPCADAFAGDFIPMVPVDPTARAQISHYRKYCKYQNIKGYTYNASEPRAIFGRWTGGCAVRWIDLSGVYTQRVCRSKHQAIMGRHFGSKRMARLEMSLIALDNGCIVSPMATLVPLSRGISLFARFHACVCTGSWCNTAVYSTPWTTNILLCLTYTSTHLK